MRTTNRRHGALLGATLLAGALLPACGGADDEPSVRFAQPDDEDSVESPVPVEMEAEGVTVEPAANGVNEGAGHFHIMIDTECVPPGEAIPNDESHLHFGDGATTAELDLQQGRHTLCLQLATGDHVATGLTDTVTITVIE